MILRTFLKRILVLLVLLVEVAWGLTLVQNTSAAEGLTEIEQTFNFARAPELDASVPFDIQQLWSDLREATQPTEEERFVRLSSDQIQSFQIRIRDMGSVRLSLLASQQAASLSQGSQGPVHYRSSNGGNVLRDLTMLMHLSEFVSTRDRDLGNHINSCYGVAENRLFKTVLGSLSVVSGVLATVIMNRAVDFFIPTKVGGLIQSIPAGVGVMIGWFCYASLMENFVAISRVPALWKRWNSIVNFFHIIFYKLTYPGEIHRSVMPLWIQAFESHLGRSLSSRERKRLESVLAETVHEVREAMLSEFCGTVLERADPVAGIRGSVDGVESSVGVGNSQGVAHDGVELHQGSGQRGVR